MIENISSNSFSSHLRLTETNANTVNKQNHQEKSEVVLETRQNLAKDQVEKVVQSVNDFIQPSNTSLKFEFHEKLGEYYVTIKDDITNETIKEVPSKKLLDMYAAMTEYLGFMIDRKI